MVQAFDDHITRRITGEEKMTRRKQHTNENFTPASDQGLEEMEQERVTDMPSRRTQAKKNVTPKSPQKNVYYNQVKFSGYIGQSYDNETRGLDYTSPDQGKERLNGSLYVKQGVNKPSMKFGVTIFYNEGKNDELFDYAEKLPARTFVDIEGSMSMYVSQKTGKEVFSILVTSLKKHVYVDEEEEEEDQEEL